jgi:hypothetical protein
MDRRRGFSGLRKGVRVVFTPENLWREFAGIVERA